MRDLLSRLPTTNAASLYGRVGHIVAPGVLGVGRELGGIHRQREQRAKEHNPF
jgi:hypothetical protein